MAWWTTYSPGNREVRYPVKWLDSPRYVGAGDYARRMTFDGRPRHYLFHVPSRVNASAPVVLVLHGGGGSASLAHFQSQMDAISDREGFVVVYPAGTNVEDEETKLYWNTGRPMKRGQLPANDVAFISRVLSDVGRCVSVDATKVFACGISNGAQMCFRLAAELNLKAIAPLCGWMTPYELTDAPERPIPMLILAGQLDSYAPVGGGGEYSPGSPFRAYSLAPLDNCAAWWRSHDGMQSPVTAKVIANHGHCWNRMTWYEEYELKLGPLSGVNLSASMWAFFKGTR